MVTSYSAAATPGSAEATPDLDEARNDWVLANEHFEHVKVEDLKDPSDTPRFTFRSAKARAAVGLPANTPIASVRQVMLFLNDPPFSEEPGEAGRCGPTSRLSCSTRSRQRERSLTRYLTTTGIATRPRSLARAKYLLGDVHFRCKEPDLARKWLEQIGSNAERRPDRAGAVLLARVPSRRDKDWLGAIRDLDAVCAMPTGRHRPQDDCRLPPGVCRQHARTRCGPRRRSRRR